MAQVKEFVGLGGGESQSTKYERNLEEEMKTRINFWSQNRKERNFPVDLKSFELFHMWFEAID